MKLPKARTDNLIEQNLKNETLIYDLNIDKAFNLNETSTIVYKACNGITTFDELKRRHKFTDDFIHLALDELKLNNLLVDEYQSPFAAVSRREVIKKVGLASMMVLPIITGLVAPKAVNAASASLGSPEPSYLAAESVCYNRIGAPLCITGYCTGGESFSGYCCSNASIGRPVFLSGETFSQVDTSPTYFPTGSTPPTSSRCPINCCSGAEPIGNCTYTPYQDEDYDPNEPTGGYTPYTATCNCACP